MEEERGLIIETFIRDYLQEGEFEQQEYEDGSRYVGGIQGEAKEGVGIYYYHNGDVYLGQWH